MEESSKGELLSLDENEIKDKIHTIRGLQVMLDSDLAGLYKVETRVLNQAVRRNIDRFPGNFMFQLNKEEFENWKSQIVTSNYVKMGLRKRQIEYKTETDQKFNKIFDAIESKSIKLEKGIFFDGQIFDAYTFVSDLVRSAGKSIILIDNYVDDSVLTLFSKRSQDVRVEIFTKEIPRQLSLDLKKYNLQYPPVSIKEFKDSHDRFMIIDDKEVYHFGASLKDLGKKWFAFSKFNKEALKILEKLGEEK